MSKTPFYVGSIQGQALRGEGGVRYRPGEVGPRDRDLRPQEPSGHVLRDALVPGRQGALQPHRAMTVCYVGGVEGREPEAVVSDTSSRAWSVKKSGP